MVEEKEALRVLVAGCKSLSELNVKLARYSGYKISLRSQVYSGVTDKICIWVYHYNAVFSLNSWKRPTVIKVEKPDWYDIEVPEGFRFE